MGGGNGKLKAQIETTRKEGERLQNHVARWRSEHDKSQNRYAEIEREHQLADQRHAESLQEPMLRLDEQHQQHESELQEERRHAQKLANALRSWQSDSQQLVASVQPRRPQLLLEVWITGCRPLETQPRSGPYLLGEQWVPYEAARATGQDGDHWDIPLAHRVCLGRNAGGKPATWPPPDCLPGAALDSSASSWRVRMRTTHTSMPTPWRKHEAPSEIFEFQLLSLANAHIDIIAGVSASGKRNSLTISAQLWRWGGTDTVVSETAEVSGQRDECGSAKGSRCSPSLKGDPWTLLFKTPATNLQAHPEGGNSGASSNGRSYTADFGQLETFRLALLLSPSLGGGTGILDPWDDNADPQLLALNGMTRCKSESCKRLTLQLEHLQGCTSPDQELQERQSVEVLTMESEQEKMLAEIEHMRCEYFEACEHAAELRSKQPSFGPRHWPAAQKYAKVQEAPPGRKSGVTIRNVSARPLAKPVGIVHGPPRPVQPPLVSPMSSREACVDKTSGSNLLMSDDVVQVYGGCEHAVPDFQMRPRTQFELCLLAKSPSQQFDSVAIKFRNLQPNTLLIAEVEAGRIHEEKLKAMVTRHLNIVLLGIFQDPPVVEVACTLCSIDKQQSRKIDHRLEFPLPIAITSFLSSLPVGRIQNAWQSAACSARWHVPEETQQELAKASRTDIDKAASCGGALSQRLHTGSSPAFLAELPLNNMIVIVTLSMSIGSTSDPKKGSTVVEVVVRSEEEYLAKSVLSVVKKHLFELAHRSNMSKTVSFAHL